jgi:hypothetical protein
MVRDRESRFNRQHDDPAAALLGAERLASARPAR